MPKRESADQCDSTSRYWNCKLETEIAEINCCNGGEKYEPRWGHVLDLFRSLVELGRDSLRFAGVTGQHAVPRTAAPEGTAAELRRRDRRVTARPRPGATVPRFACLLLLRLRCCAAIHRVPREPQVASPSSLPFWCAWACAARRRRRQRARRRRRQGQERRQRAQRRRWSSLAWSGEERSLLFDTRLSEDE